MVTSNQSQDVIALGKRICDELELPDSCDTLAKWMAHYLAEQIKLAETESDPALKQKAEQKCVELILRLWKKRFNMPGKVSPLSSLKDAIEAIQEMKAEQDKLGRMRHCVTKNDNPWFEFACTSYSSDKKTSTIAYLTGVLESDIGATKQWMDEHENMLSSEEKELIGSLDDWLNDETPWDINGNVISVGTLQPEERTNTVLHCLEEGVQQQIDALQHLKNQLSAEDGNPKT